MTLEQRQADDVGALTDFLRGVDLTLSGLDDPHVRLWLERDETGAIVGSTGYELSTDGAHALIRSVAVAPASRSRGRGRTLGRFALDQAAAESAQTAWLFSRRSGAFWQSLGLLPADRGELAAALSNTHQVRHFTATGQLSTEVAWRRPLRPA